MSTAVRKAIDRGDVEALRALVRQDSALAAAPVPSVDGKHALPPLHLVCDAVFGRRATQDQALAMADVLLDAGVDPDLAYAASGDGFLIAAASLGAEGVGLRLVERGADVARRGLFGASALHWAAIMGLDRLALALLDAGAELEVRDTKYDCTPLEWALHGWSEGSSGERDGIPRVSRVLVERGARVPPDAPANLAGDAHAAMRAALGL